MFDTCDHLTNFTMTKKKIKLDKDDNHKMILDTYQIKISTT